MGRYLKFEENDDGTCTAEIQLVEHDLPVTFLIPMPFDAFMGLIASDTVVMERSLQVAQGNMIYIPNTAEG